MGVIRQVLGRSEGQRVAVVSSNEGLLTEVRRRTAGAGVACFELFTVEDMDLWRAQTGGPLSAMLVLSKTEAVKGFEFDTVVLCDLSAGAVPYPGTPPTEYWREAAVVYSAMTRARDELILTYAGEPSAFLVAVAGKVMWVRAADETPLGDALSRIG
jgi:superfamily I DNA/RNA helicase